MDETQVEAKLEEHHSRLQMVEAEFGALKEKVAELFSHKETVAAAQVPVVDSAVTDAQVHAQAGIATVDQQAVLAAHVDDQKAAVAGSAV